MRVCANGSLQAWSGPHGPCWFLPHWTLDTMPTERFLAMGMDEFRFLREVQPYAKMRDTVQVMKPENLTWEEMTA